MRAVRALRRVAAVVMALALFLAGAGVVLAFVRGPQEAASVGLALAVVVSLLAVGLELGADRIVMHRYRQSVREGERQQREAQKAQRQQRKKSKAGRS